jgi:hypothetical protein
MEQRCSEVEFAHPAERALAAAFDELGVAWRYEPRTFVLESERGRVLEACTPDFYLPDLDIYVECTVMRQKHVTAKNRKFRKLRTRFGVVAEIMYRRDFIRLARAHGLRDLERAARTHDPPA